MKRNKVILISCGIVIALIAVCLSFGKGQNTQQTVPTQTADPASQYMLAAEQVRASDCVSYYIATIRTTDYSGQTFTSYSQQRLNIQDPGKDTMRVFMTETLDFGKYSVDLCEYYENGNGFVTVNGNAFTAPVSLEAFSSRYTPAICIDPSLYIKVSSAPLGSCTRIFFADPVAAENWALPDGATFTDASGYALLDKVGTLLESVYSVSYSIDTASVTQETKIIMVNHCQLTPPGNANAYTQIEFFDAPRMLEQACGYLVQAENVKSSAETIIDCQTFLIHRTQKSDLTLRGSGEDFYALLDVKINQINQSRGGEITEFRQTEAFENGKYTISLNGAAATGNKAIDAAAMKEYCQDVLIGDILLPSHIVGAAAEETDTAVILTFQPSDTLAEAICSNICNTLYSDGELLHTLSSDYNTQSIQCVLILDKYTGLPQSFSSEYSASHTIERIAYQLESKTEQTYQYTETSGQ